MALGGRGQQAWWTAGKPRGALWECVSGPGRGPANLSAPPALLFHCPPRSLVFSPNPGSVGHSALSQSHNSFLPVPPLLQGCVHQISFRDARGSLLRGSPPPKTSACRPSCPSGRVTVSTVGRVLPGRGDWGWGCRVGCACHSVCCRCPVRVVPVGSGFGKGLLCCWGKRTLDS